MTMTTMTYGLLVRLCETSVFLAIMHRRLESGNQCKNWGLTSNLVALVAALPRWNDPLYCLVKNRIFRTMICMYVM